MRQTHLRIARTDDLETVRALNATCFPYDAPMQEDTYENSLWWLAWEGSEAVGYAGLYLGIRGEAWLVRVGVLSAFRSRGIGGRLLRTRIAAARRLEAENAVRRVVTYVADWNEPSSRNVISAGMRPYRAEKGWIYYDLEVGQ